MLEKTQSKRVTDYLRAIRAANRGGMTDEQLEGKIKQTRRALQNAQDAGNLANELQYTARLYHLERMDSSNGRLTELREDFVRYGAQYAEKKNIPYAVWRQFGVPPAVLKEAGIAS